MIITEKQEERQERKALETAFHHALAFRESLSRRPPRPTCDDGYLDFAFGKATPETGSSAESVIEQLVAAADPGLMGVCGSRFFGWVIGSSHLAGVAADMLASAWGQNAGNFHASPAAAMAEKTASKWLLDILNLPSECSVGFVTGATMANFTCLAAARNEVLNRVGWDMEADGLPGAPAINVFIGADAHTTVFNALQYLGLGRNRSTTIRTDEQGRMCAITLAEQLERHVGPKIVIAQAGQINTGAMDPFQEIVKVCHSAGAWLHVDGAFGLWANACPSLRPLIAGVEKADSWATDGHKWLQLPYDSGFAIVRHPAAHSRAMTTSASYLPQIRGVQHEASQYVPELSRRARGFAAWSVLKTLGREGVVEMVERHCAFAGELAEKLSGVPGITIENRVELNQIILSFGSSLGEPESERLTREVIREIQHHNKVFVEGGSWRGKWVMRISIISAPTRREDIETLFTEIKRAWAHVQEGAAQTDQADIQTDTMKYTENPA